MALVSRNRRIGSSIDLTPLIDVVFQLLIFLMVSSQFTKPETLVELPRTPAEAPQVDPKKDNLTLVILADGRLVFEGRSVEKDQLPMAVREAIEERDIRRIEFRGDQEAQLGLFVEVMEIARENGVESMAIIKKRKEPSSE
ncbi:MAG: biopolymer transporter ExbD [Verrucomicrobiota bacterium]